MIEVLFAVGIVGLLLGVAALGQLAWYGLLSAGLWMAAAGMLAGLPAGLGYHLALHRALRRQGPLPRRWWLNPTALHGRLGPDDRRAVMPFFVVGALGFLITLAGCIALGVGAARGLSA